MPYRCLNCGSSSDTRDWTCDAPGCGFKVGRFEWELDTSPSEPYNEVTAFFGTVFLGAFLGLMTTLGVFVLFVVLGILGNLSGSNPPSAWNAIATWVPRIAGFIAFVGFVVAEHGENWGLKK